MLVIDDEGESNGVVEGDAAAGVAGDGLHVAAVDDDAVVAVVDDVPTVGTWWSRTHPTSEESLHEEGHGLEVKRRKS